MKFTHDPKTDAEYLAFKEPRGEVTTIRLNQDIAVDLGQAEEVVGIEVLAASEHLGISKAIRLSICRTSPLHRYQPYPPIRKL